MRLSRFSPWFAVFAGCLASAFLACGSDVDEVPFDSSSASSSGAGAAGSTSTAAGGSSTATSGPSSSSVASSTAASSTSGNGGSGGVGTPCEEACEKIDSECGFGDLCSQVPQLDCGSAPGADCYGQCVLDADCAAIASLAGANPDPALSACLLGCQQGGQGGAGGGGGAGVGGGGVGGGSAAECLDCGQNACFTRGLACFQDAACSAWLDCIQPCADAPCVMACDVSNPGGPVSDDVKECLCTSCTAECGGAFTCN